MNDDLGKKAEIKIKEWLDRPEEGYCFDRIPDQLSGFYGSKNICDFTLYKHPYKYYIESKSTYEDRFDFVNISEYQRDHMYEKSKIFGVYSILIVLFATYKQAFLFNIADIYDIWMNKNIKSLNIKKKNKWDLPFVEIPTIPNNRKLLLDYQGEFDTLVQQLFIQ